MIDINDLAKREQKKQELQETINLIGLGKIFHVPDRSEPFFELNMKIFLEKVLALSVSCCEVGLMTEEELSIVEQQIAVVLMKLDAQMQ